ncbi:ABC transporter substrate-binding protein [Dactylosporangium sp. AC04546]|uniref:ABC transporter substrate-binding protein n=1 Tax=Dactylosporangium sp. AC04546 TaxID=2862460 RepID=UPI001EDF22F4|nr:ABC transporter substrate-binding protein [Dactylosporangium sp. AC04546]WVK79927.1 ABC transporter substrate-binding protein [Dactylosporangium sp. AC04546]
MRRRLLGALAASALVAALGACGGGDEASGGKTEVVFSYLWAGEEAAALEKIITDFNASQDKITVKGVSSPDFQKQLTSMSGAQGSFDISDHFGSGVGAWASKGILTPLDDFIKADGYDTKDFPAAAMSQMVYQGKTYSMPIALHTQMLLYNKKLYAEAGLAGPPKTTEEWAEQIAKLTKRGADGTITQLGYANAEINTSFTTLGFMFGGSWDDQSGASTPANPGNVAGLSFYTDNIPGKYGVEQVRKFTSGFGEYASAQNAFYTGKAATIIDGEWQPVAIKKFAPTLEWGVAPLPYPSAQPNLAGTTQVTTSTLFIPRNAKHPKEAWEFMKYLLAKDAMTKFSLALGNLPARTSLVDDPQYKALPQFDAWLGALKSTNARSLASSPWAAQYTADLAQAFDDIAQQRKAPNDGLAGVAQKAKSYAP